MKRGIRGFLFLFGLLLVAASSHPEIFAPVRWASECARHGLGVGRAEANGGCCHFGGGVCGCRAGRAVCCKGGMSSCPCGGAARSEAEPATRQGPRDDQRDGPPVQLSSVVFADQDNRLPLVSQTSFKAGQKMWVWVDLHCPDLCLTRLASFGENEISLSSH